MYEDRAIQQLERDIHHFKAQVKRRFPTMVGVVALGEYTSRHMKAERQQRRSEALQRRAQKAVN